MNYTDKIKSYIEQLDGLIFNDPYPAFQIPTFPGFAGIAGFAWKPKIEACTHFELLDLQKESLRKSVDVFKDFVKDNASSKDTPLYKRAEQQITEVGLIIHFLETEFLAVYERFQQKKGYYVVNNANGMVQKTMSIDIPYIAKILGISVELAEDAMSLGIATHEVRHRKQFDGFPGIDVRIIGPKEKHHLGLPLRSVAKETKRFIQEYTLDTPELYSMSDEFVEYDAEFFGTLVRAYVKKHKQLPPIDMIAKIIKTEKSVAELR